MNVWVTLITIFCSLIGVVFLLAKEKGDLRIIAIFIATIGVFVGIILYKQQDESSEPQPNSKSNATSSINAISFTNAISATSSDAKEVVDYESENDTLAFELGTLKEDHGAGLTKFVYYNNQVYYSPKGCFLQADDSIVVLENFEVENNLSKAISIHNIYFEVDSYENNSDPVKYYFYGDTGNPSYNHIFYGNIDTVESRYTLQYGGDSDVYFDSNNSYEFDFQPTGSHVSINSSEYEYFTMALIFKESGLYKFHYSVEYACGNTTTIIDSPEIVRYISDSFQNIPKFNGSDTEHFTSNMEELYNLSYEMAEGKSSYDSHFDEVLNNAIADYEENHSKYEKAW